MTCDLVHLAFGSNVRSKEIQKFPELTKERVLLFFVKWNSEVRLFCSIICLVNGV